MRNQTLSLENDRLSAEKRTAKMTVDPKTQFSYIKAINKAREETWVVSVSEAVNRTRRVNIATGRAEISVEYW